MRISDWSSDVCSSDLLGEGLPGLLHQPHAARDFLSGLGDEFLDILCRRSGALRKFADFLRDDCKSLAGIAGTGSFNAGIERQKIGLEGDLVDDIGDLGDLVRTIGRAWCRERVCQYG